MENNEQQLDISGLWPDFSVFPSIATAADLSAIFVVALILIFLGFLLFGVVPSWFRAKRRVSWLTALLSGESEESVFSNRHDLLAKVEKRGGTEAHLWNEFDETLMEVKEGDRPKLCNVYDADYFFNATSLAPGITESRLMAAVPGFLTAIGVIGTFVGLQLGLSELNIGNDVAVDEMKAGLAHVISGAKLAFMTSVWGVFLSVLFNFIEKWLENGVRKRIGNLQIRIDEIFPRLTAEMQLKRIADDGGESREALQGLAEKIGEKMQESLIEVTSGIQQGLEQSLQNVMGPAMDRLVNDASDGSQRALEQLIESFMDKFGQQGAAQRESMDSASKGVSDAVESMNQALNGFISNLNQNQQAAAEREQGLIQHISNQVDELVERTTEFQQKAGQATEEQLKNFGELFEKQARTSVSLQSGLTNNIKDQLTGMADHNREQQQQLAEVNQAQIQAMQTALQKYQLESGNREKELIGHISQQVDALVERTAAQQKQTGEAAAEQLQNFGELFNKQAQTSASLQSGLTQNLKEQIAGMADHNRQQQQEFVASTQAQIKAIQDSLNQHQSASGEREKELIGHISKQVDSLVSHAQQQAEKITRATGSQLGNMNQLIEQAQQKQSERDSALGKQFESAIADMQVTMQQQIEAAQLLLSDGKQLHLDMANNSQNLQRLATSIMDGSTELTRSTTALKEYGATVQQASTKLSTSIQAASESTANLASENLRAAESVSKVRDQIQSAIATMQDTVGNLDRMVQLADGSFKTLEQHQNSYLATLRENIEQLADQGTKLLSNYAEQANGQTAIQLQAWAKGTTEYAETMNEAVRNLSSVVDEIETKVGSR